MDKIEELLERMGPILRFLDGHGFRETSRVYSEESFGNICVRFESKAGIASLVRDRGFLGLDMMSKSYPYSETNVLSVLAFLGERKAYSLEQLRRQLDNRYIDIMYTLGSKVNYDELTNADVFDVESLEEFLESTNVSS